MSLAQQQIFDESDSVGDLDDRFMPAGGHVLHHGDSRDLLGSLPDQSVALTVTSPPYGIGKEYEEHTDVESYLASFEWVVDELARVTSDTGSVCWQVGNHVDNGEIVPLDIAWFPLFHDRGFKLRNRVVWTYGHGLHASNRFSGRYETIMWFTRGNEYVFNLDDVRVPSRYPGKKHHKGERRGQLSGNPLGKNPGDVWTIMSAEWDYGVLEVPNVKHRHPEKTAHPCQFPIEVAQRCVLALTDPGVVVVDPFGGSGSTLLAAALSGRRGVVGDENAEYCMIARDRFEMLRRGELPYRRIGTPIASPTPAPTAIGPGLFDG